MNRLLVTTLALALSATAGAASAQSTYGSSGRYDQSYPDRYGQSSGGQYDYARVLRVDPVFDSYGAGNHGAGSQQRCYERPTYVNGNDGYYNGDNDGYYRRNDGGYDPYGGYRRSTGSESGRTIATVIGGVVGAAVGSQVGGGSARYATSAIGSMVGGLAGRQIYEQNQRQRDRVGTVRVCDPVPAGNGSLVDGAVNAYDVTYEYAGRSYTTRTNYHPGDRIRVRVDVRPE
ncbi:glycine zipper 2TM domain-containing protein [Lysobacter cavernae]|uniref:Glycine zipper 2TM domain-containing protein n=1 Tax=Lysobacter cavernae TaxID=1685901 RepID=A0ABV7RKK1_9GAMM